MGSWYHGVSTRSHLRQETVAQGSWLGKVAQDCSTCNSVALSQRLQFHHPPCPTYAKYTVLVGEVSFHVQVLVFVCRGHKIAHPKWLVTMQAEIVQEAKANCKSTRYYHYMGAHQYLSHTQVVIPKYAGARRRDHVQHRPDDVTKSKLVVPGRDNPKIVTKRGINGRF